MAIINSVNNTPVSIPLWVESLNLISAFPPITTLTPTDYTVDQIFAVGSTITRSFHFDYVGTGFSAGATTGSPPATGTITSIDVDYFSDAGFLSGQVVETHFAISGLLLDAATYFASTNKVALALSGNDTINGGTGNDVLAGYAGNDALNGGAGIDMANYSAATSNIVAVADSGAGTGYAYGGVDVGSDTFSSIENVTGGNGSDYIYSGHAAGAHVLHGGAGAMDVLVASTNAGSTDTLWGDGGGYDYLFAGAGTATLNGAGTVTGNVVIMNGGSGAVTMNGGDFATNYFYSGTGAAVMNGGGGSALNIFVTAAETVGETINCIGRSYVYSGNKGDTVHGSFFTDVFVGGSGNDSFQGGWGVNYAWGGGGRDTFVLDIAADQYMVVQDFGFGGVHDIVRFLNTGMTSFADVQAHEFYVAATNTTIITPSVGHATWLIGVAPSQLNASEFLFA